MQKMDMLSMTQKEWEEILKQWGEPTFRAKQIFDWLHKKHITEIEDKDKYFKKSKRKIKTIWCYFWCKTSKKISFTNRWHYKIFV